jgi:hypothetical protein
MRWRRKPHDTVRELGELDPFLLAMIARVVEVRTEAAPDGEWVRMDQVAAVCVRLADALKAALQSGWDREAEERMLVERREGPDGVEVRLTRRGRDVMGPMLG